MASTETRDDLSTTCNLKVMSRCLSAPDATSLHHCLQNHHQQACCSQPWEIGVSYVASGADRHLDITFGLQVVESSSHVSVLFREAFSHPYISFFHLLVNGFSVTCLLFHLNDKYR